LPVSYAIKPRLHRLAAKQEARALGPPNLNFKPQI